MAPSRSRNRGIRTTGQVPHEAVRGLNSLSPSGPRPMPGPGWGHRCVVNRVRHVRDESCDARGAPAASRATSRARPTPPCSLCTTRDVLTMFQARFLYACGPVFPPGERRPAGAGDLASNGAGAHLTTSRHRARGGATIGRCCTRENSMKNRTRSSASTRCRTSGTMTALEAGSTRNERWIGGPA